MSEESKAPEVPGSAQGLGGPNPTPTFGNRPQTDNNRPVEEQSELDSFVEGANAAADAAVAGNVDDHLAVASVGDEREGKVSYASPNIARLRVGQFQFENGVLHLDADQVEDFEKLLSTSSTRTQQAVRKIDREGGEAVARAFLSKTQGARTSGVDTTAGSVKAPTPGEGDPPKLPVA
jgi:hypothetical protein